MTTQLTRLLYPYGSERSVLRGDARGMRFVVEPGMACSYAAGLEEAAPRLFRKYVSPGMTVLDVGANKGQMALILAALVGPFGTVVAIEPAPGPFATLQRNIRLNNLHNVHPLDIAAADVAGNVEFLFDPELPTQGRLATVEKTQVHPRARRTVVPAVPLDALIGRLPSGPDFIKIDVEGAGAAALKGAAKILATCNPVIYIELHGPEEQAGVRDEVLSRGYIAETLDGDPIDDPVSTWHSPLVCRRLHITCPDARHRYGSAA